MKPEKTTVRLTVRLDAETHATAMKQAKAAGIVLNEYVAAAIMEKAAHDNGQWDDTPDIIVARLGQLIDIIASLTSSFDRDTQAILSALRSLVELTRGDSSYLSTDEE